MARISESIDSASLDHFPIKSHPSHPVAKRKSPPLPPLPRQVGRLGRVRRMNHRPVHPFRRRTSGGVIYQWLLRVKYLLLNQPITHPVKAIHHVTWSPGSNRSVLSFPKLWNILMMITRFVVPTGVNFEIIINFKLFFFFKKSNINCGLFGSPFT